METFKEIYTKYLLEKGGKNSGRNPGNAGEKRGAGFRIGEHNGTNHPDLQNNEKS